MLAKRISRRRTLVFAIAIAAGIGAGRGTAQSSSSSISTGASIVLPQKLVAGQQATLAVLDQTGGLTQGAAVEFSGGERVTTDVTGRATFIAPATPGVLLARLPGLSVTASTTVVAPLQVSPGGPQMLDYPRVISLADRFAVAGSGFRGEADGNRALLGDQTALVLAASPVELVLLAGPRAAAGPTQLLIEVGEHSLGPVPVTLVSLELSATKKQLAPREKGKLTVRVRGSEQRLVIEARNLTPEVVKLSQGNVQRVKSSGGANNIAEIEMQGLRVGDFSLSARLVPGAAGLPDMEAVRQRLLAARRLATGDWPERVDRVIHRIESNPQDVLRAQEELEKMLAERPEGEFGRLLEAAWRELLKR